MLETVVSQYVRPDAAWHDRQNDDGCYREPGYYPSQHYNLHHTLPFLLGDALLPVNRPDFRDTSGA